MPTPAVPTRIRRSATDIVRRARFVIVPRPAGPRRHRPHGLNFLERIASVNSGPPERAARALARNVPNTPTHTSNFWTWVTPQVEHSLHGRGDRAAPVRRHDGER